MNQTERRRLISLGRRCDIAFQLRMHSGDNTAHVFDWLSVPIPGVIRIIDRDFDVFAPQDLVYCGHSLPGYVMDRPTGTRFHHQFPFRDGRVDSDFLRAYDPFRAKFRHLAQRFRDYLATGPVTLVRSDLSEAEALQLEDVVVARFPQADVRFLYLVAEGDLFQTGLGRARRLAAHRSVGDPLASAELFRDEGLIEAPFRLSTLDIFGRLEEGYNLSVDNRLTVAELEAAQAINPGNPGFAYELARLHRNEGRLDAALASIVKACQAAPGNVVIAAEDLRIRWALKQFDGRVYIMGLAALVVEDDPADIARVAANGLVELGEYEEAARCYAAHVRRHPDDAAALLARSRCLARLRRWDEAVADARTAWTLTPTPDLAYNLAELYEQMGDIARAVETYEAVESSADAAVNGRALERLAVLRSAVGPN